MGLDSTKYKNDYQKEKYDRIIVNVPKGQRDKIKEIASQNGKSLNSYIVDLINSDLSNYNNYIPDSPTANNPPIDPPPIHQ